jgi:predicted phage-related endonuclease
VSTLFGLNSFTNIVELFWNKVRLTPPTPHNENSYSGELHEDLVMKKYFVYHDPSNPTPERMLQNAEANKKLRRVQRFRRGIFMNSIPIACTLDYLCLPDEYAPEGAVVEVKNMLGHVVGRYESGIIPGHLLQVQAQLMCTGLKKAYLVYYVDGRFFRCYGIEASEELQEQIKERVIEFWDDHVVPARKIWNDPLMTEQNKMIKIYDAFEPAIDPSSQESLQAFMNTRFKESTKLGKVMVTDELQGFLDGYKANRTMETDYAKTKAMFGNELRSALIAYSCDEISSADGKVLASYREDSAGKLILRVN